MKGAGSLMLDVSQRLPSKLYNMSFKFEKLIVWQKAMDFGEEIFALANKFHKAEQYNLVSQMTRAADSVALNISEGSILQSTPEFSRFLGYSIRSVAEVVTCLHKAQRRKYIAQEEFIKQYDEGYHLMNMLIAFGITSSIQHPASFHLFEARK